MLVHQILKAKGDDGVICVKPGTSVADAARILAERKIGGVLVSPDGQVPVGILSERDIVRELSKSGAVCLQQMVDDLMTPDPVCCTREESADAVLTRMTDGRFRHMPVVQDGLLVGMVTIGDVVKARLEELKMERNALEGMIMGH